MELVTLTPVLLMVVLVLVALGRVAEARQQVVEAARAGAEYGGIGPGQRPGGLGGGPRPSAPRATSGPARCVRSRPTPVTSIRAGT